MPNAESKAHSAKGLLFVIQIDHLSGETLGSVIEYFYAAGALNVQVLNSVTKKNRPGLVALIDAPPAKAEDIERIIVEELGVSGWHRLATEHRHLPVETIVVRVTLKTRSGWRDFDLKGKRIVGRPESVRPEHGSCQDLKKILSTECGLDISLGQVYARTLRHLQSRAFSEELGDFTEGWT